MKFEKKNVDVGSRNTGEEMKLNSEYFQKHSSKGTNVFF